MSTYTRFQQEDVVEANQTIITTGLWSGDEGSLDQDSLFLSETQINSSGEYYFDVYNKSPNDADKGSPIYSDTAEVQFAIAYGHINGGGAPTIGENERATLPTKAIYRQYKNLLLQPGDEKFIFESQPSDHIYVINIQRARVKEQLDPGNWELPLSGANDLHTFIDDSGETLGAFAANSQAGRVFRVISGSLTGGENGGPLIGSATASNGAGFGYVYPDLGIIVLNPNAICPTVGFFVSASEIGSSLNDDVGAELSTTEPAKAPIYTGPNVKTLNTISALPFAPLIDKPETYDGESAAYNHAGLYVSMKLAIADANADFRARSAETISSTHYFVRLRNSEYNYSNNPTFSNADDGTLEIAEFREDPKVYITTVGMYNDQNELLAVAKLSKPVRKTFSEEVLLRVRLDF
jgi:hypothetical protein